VLSWQHGLHSNALSGPGGQVGGRHDGVAWRAPDRSAVFLPWSAPAGAYETERLFLIMDAEGRTVRGFVPKTGRTDLPSDADLGRLIRERIRTAIS
jgi:hypothetical protein